MTNYEAVGIAEGFIEADNADQVIEAWQHLHDTRLAYSLQGWFGRNRKREWKWRQSVADSIKPNINYIS